MHGASNQDTHLQRPRNNSSVHAHPSTECRCTASQVETLLCTHRTRTHQFWSIQPQSTARLSGAHTRHIDPAINDALRIVTGCLRPTPADNLHILAGNKPAGLHRSGATLSLARHAMAHGHLLHSALASPPSGNARRLKSKHPFVPAPQHLSLSDNNIRAAQWAGHRWNAD